MIFYQYNNAKIKSVQYKHVTKIIIKSIYNEYYQPQLAFSLIYLLYYYYIINLIIKKNSIKKLSEIIQPLSKYPIKTIFLILQSQQVHRKLIKTFMLYPLLYKIMNQLTIIIYPNTQFYFKKLSIFLTKTSHFIIFFIILSHHTKDFYNIKPQILNLKS